MDCHQLPHGTPAASAISATMCSRDHPSGKEEVEPPPPPQQQQQQQEEEEEKDEEEEEAAPGHEPPLHQHQHEHHHQQHQHITMPTPTLCFTPSDTGTNPVYRYRRDASRHAGDTDPSALSVLFSQAGSETYVILEPMADLQLTNEDRERVYLAAPTAVLSRCAHEPALAHEDQLTQLLLTFSCHGMPCHVGDALVRPHPEKRVVVKRIAKAWVRAMAAEHARGGPVGELAARRRLTQSPEHPHVMPLIDTVVDEHFVYLVMPYADGGELFSLVQASGTGLPEAVARRCLLQIVLGLQHLQRHSLAHGDVSLENVVLCRAPAANARENQEGSGGVSAAYTCRLIDFGLCRSMPEPEGTPLDGRLLGGKAAYMAPEVARGTVRDWYASDVWSLGVCLYNLLTGMQLYVNPRDEAFGLLQRQGGAQQILCHHIVTLGVGISPAAAHLIANMLHAVPAERPTLQEVLRHPWVVNAVSEEGTP